MIRSLCLPAFMLIASAAPLAAETLPDWLTFPSWQQQVDAVKAAEGEGASSHEARPGSQIDGLDFLLSAPTQIATVAANREFYFDGAKNLALIRIVPATTDPANCDAFLAAAMQALGKQDEQPATNAIPLRLMDERYWFRSKQDRLYHWIQIKSLRSTSANTPCHLLIEPYKTGMAKKKKA